MTSEEAIEKEIQDKGLNAPRLTPAHIDKTIVSETYTNLPNGCSIVCQLTLVNGYTVIGTSSCVSADNFNQEIGNKIAKENAREKIWELEGYLLKQRLYEQDNKTVIHIDVSMIDEDGLISVLRDIDETWTQYQIHDAS